MYTTTDKRISALTPAQNRSEVFESINSNRVAVDRSSFKHDVLDKVKLKRLKREFKHQVS